VSSEGRMVTARREKRQSMGLSLNEGMVLPPGKIEAAAHGLADAGYGIVRTMLRSTNLTHRSAAVVDAVRRLTEVAHERGMLVVLDCEPHIIPVAYDMGEQFPEAMATRLLRGECKLINGNFLIHFPVPTSEGRNDFLDLEAVFIRDASGKIERLESIPFQLRFEQEAFRTGYTTAEDYYVEGKAGWFKHVPRIFGTLEDHLSGSLIAYARFSDFHQIDFWSKGCGEYYDALLECYRDIPLDGVGWDEPAINGDWSSYLYGNSFKQAFQDLNGYALAEHLYLLDEPGISSESARVRVDYYRTLNEGIFQAEKRLFDKAGELFGPDLILGTHHTWQGEGGINDYRAGAVNYFRLNENMDAGYTDCSWWDPGSVAYAYTLASSLGRLTPSGDAEVNTWNNKPTNSQVEYNSRLMTLLNITWFNIWYGEMTDTCLYPAHYTWETTLRELPRHREQQQLLGSAKPVVSIAMLHGWEGVVGINRPGIAGAQKTFCINTARLYIERSVAFDWIDSQQLAEASIEGTEFVNALGKYSVLVLPYATVLPRAAWENVANFAKAKGRVVFVGTPPQWDLEGNSLVEAFAELLGAEPLPAADYLAAIDSRCTLPHGRPDKLDVYYPLAKGTERLRVSLEGEPHGITSADGNVIYLTDLDPRDRLLDILNGWVAPEVACFSDSILWRLYREGDRDLLVLAARKDRQLSGIIRFAGKTIEFQGGVAAVIESAGEELTVHGDGIVWKEIE
jgi:hypothetical protein